LFDNNKTDLSEPSSTVKRDLLAYLKITFFVILTCDSGRKKATQKFLAGFIKVFSSAIVLKVVGNGSNATTRWQKSIDFSANCEASSNKTDWKNTEVEEFGSIVSPS